MKIQLIALFGLLLTAATAFPETDKAGVFTSAIAEAYRAHDVKAIMAFYFTDGVSHADIKKEQERWETMFNKSATSMCPTIKDVGNHDEN